MNPLICFHILRNLLVKVPCCDILLDHFNVTVRSIHLTLMITHYCTEIRVYKQVLPELRPCIRHCDVVALPMVIKLIEMNKPQCFLIPIYS